MQRHNAPSHAPARPRFTRLQHSTATIIRSVLIACVFTCAGGSAASLVAASGRGLPPGPVPHGHGVALTAHSGVPHEDDTTAVTSRRPARQRREARARSGDTGGRTDSTGRRVRTDREGAGRDRVTGADEKGRTLYTGPRGGVYYLTESGEKVYVRKKRGSSRR